MALTGITTDGEVLNSQSHGGNTQATGRFFINDKNGLRLNYERRRGADIGSATLVDVFNGYFPFSNRDKFSGRYDLADVTPHLQRVSISGFYQSQLRNFTNVLTVPRREQRSTTDRHGVDADLFESHCAELSQRSRRESQEFCSICSE